METVQHVSSSRATLFCIITTRGSATMRVEKVLRVNKRIIREIICMNICEAKCILSKLSSSTILQLIQYFLILSLSTVNCGKKKEKKKMRNSMKHKNPQDHLSDNWYSRDENKPEEIISVHSRRTNDGKELLVRGLSMRFSVPASSVAVVRT